MSIEQNKTIEVDADEFKKLMFIFEFFRNRARKSDLNLIHPEFNDYIIEGYQIVSKKFFDEEMLKNIVDEHKINLYRKYSINNGENK